MSVPAVKAVVDCSQTGALDPERAEALAAAVREAALAAIEDGDLQRAATLMQDAADTAASGVETTAQIVPLTADELAEHQASQAEAHRGRLLAHIRDALAATDRDVLTALENGDPVPKKIATHRAKLRDLAATVETAPVEELNKVKIPAPPKDA